MQDSKFQIAIYEDVKDYRNNVYDLLVKATAGSGKTTTIVNASKLLPVYLDILFLAFNNSIVYELKTRLPKTVECRTLHSFGFGSLYKFYKTKKITLKKHKTLSFFKNVIKDKKISASDIDKMGWVVSEILDKARLNHVENDFESLCKISDYYGIVYENRDIEIASEVYDELINYNEIKVSEEKIIDFVDMIYLPSYYDVELPKFDIIFVDEAQDLNKCQQILVQKIKKPKGRAIYVGDENQAIYMFAGADANSFNSIIGEQGKSLPLSVCYRCAKKIVVEAQHVVGPENIQYFDGQEDGLVTIGKWSDIREGDFVVCRNNAPLFSLYFDLLGEGIKASVKGKELERQLLNLVKKVRYSNVDEGKEKLGLMLEKIEDELRKKGYVDPTKSNRWKNFMDMSNIINFLAKGKDMMVEVEDDLNQIFNNDNDAVILMTIHKSKGLEADTVHFLNPELIPSKFAETQEELLQERNLRFVATTRAKTHLNYIYNYKSKVEDVNG